MKVEKVLLIIIGLILLIYYFYWFHYRPSQIRIACFNKVRDVKPKTGEGMNAVYGFCLTSKGVKSEKLIIGSP